MGQYLSGIFIHTLDLVLTVIMFHGAALLIVEFTSEKGGEIILILEGGLLIMLAILLAIKIVKDALNLFFVINNVIYSRI